MTQRERQILRWIEENPMISQQELAGRAGITRSSVAVHVSHLMKKGLIAGRGYVLAEEPYVLVIGGVNLDICGQSAAPLRTGDSNPGRVYTGLGGVGRNIAHNMRLLGLRVKMVTAFGDDSFAQRITASCQALGIDVSRALRVPGAATSTYLFITDPNGDMALAVSDMSIYDRLTPGVLAERKSLADNARAVVIDTNLPEESITWLCENTEVPIFADPVSTVKAEKLRPVLGRIHTLKPNRLEAELLSGVEIRDEAGLNAAADALLERGVKRVFITLGKDGTLAADKKERCRIRAPRGTVVNTTGCGDAYTAGLVWAYLQGLDLRGSALAGQAAAAAAMESRETINSALSESLLRERMDNKEQ